MSSTFQSINTFQHRCVRDLAWVIASPPLVSGRYNQTRWWSHKDCLNEFEDCLTTLKLLDKNPESLTNHLNQLNSKRLGNRFEALVSFWFDKVSPNYALLTQNIQLFETTHTDGKTDKLTIGEIDFIIQNTKTQKTIHLEVAVKFYLGTPDYKDPYRWFGTNLNDQLGKKLEHLKNHQTQLLTQHPNQTNFQIDEKHCLFKGRLFYPLNIDTPPEGVTTHHLRGLWLHSSKFSNLDRMSPKGLIALKKNEWFAELNSDDIASHTIENTFRMQNRPQCYSTISSRGDKKIEAERLFLLPDTFQLPSSSIDK